MLKHIDDVRKSAKERAKRRWQNYQVEKSFKEAKAKAADGAPLQLKEAPSPADVISNSKPDGRGSVIKAQTKFALYIRELLAGHTKQDQERIKLMYVLSIRAQRYRLLKEKLRRLEAREAERVALQASTHSQTVAQQTALKSRDLFS